MTCGVEGVFSWVEDNVEVAECCFVQVFSKRGGLSGGWLFAWLRRFLENVSDIASKRQGKVYMLLGKVKYGFTWGLVAF